MDTVLNHIPGEHDLYRKHSGFLYAINLGKVAVSGAAVALFIIGAVNVLSQIFASHWTLSNDTWLMGFTALGAVLGASGAAWRWHSHTKTQREWDERKLGKDYTVCDRSD